MYISTPSRLPTSLENPDLIHDVEKFHTKFNLMPRDLGAPIDKELTQFRIKFLAEELKEANEAAARADLPGLLDALVDLVYVAIGTAYTLNLNFGDAWKNVQAANMAKIKASADNPSKRGYSGDIVKPAGWRAPDHDSLFIGPDLGHDPLTTDKGLVDLPDYFKN